MLLWTCWLQLKESSRLQTKTRSQVCRFPSVTSLIWSLLASFYRATLCMSMSVRLSVCPSLSGIVSKRLNLSSKFCYNMTAPTLQFTMNQIAFRNSSGITPNGGHKYRRGIKNSRFLTNKPLYHGNGAMSYSKTARFGFRLPWMTLEGDILSASANLWIATFLKLYCIIYVAYYTVLVW